MSLRNKVLAGILSGAIIFTGGIALNPVQAAPFENEQQQESPRHERHKMSDEQIGKFANDIAEKYNVNSSEVEAALKSGVQFKDVKIAALLAKMSGKSFSEVLEMRSDWKQVAEKLGITHEQIGEFMKAEMIEDLAKNSKLDAKTVESLLKDRYDPMDITFAGLIANASGKNVKSVLSKRKINNTWEDVAKEFNVDLKKIMPPKPERRH